MVVRKWTLVYVALLGLALAQSGGSYNPQQPGKNTDPTQPQQAKPPKATLTGKVSAADTAQPLKKAFLVLRQIGERRPQTFGATTDENGNFRFKEVDPGRYNMTVTRNGYVRQIYGQKGPNTPGTVLEVAAGQELKDLNVRLIQGGVITGRILDEDGEPLVRVGVNLLRYNYQDGEKRLVPAANAITDDRGDFRFYNLQPRSYYMSASLRAFGMGVNFELGGGSPMNGPDSPDEGYATQYYPGVLDPSQGATIAVRAGEESRADMTLLPVHTYRVRGKLVDSQTGAGAKQAMIYLYPRAQNVMRFGGGNNAFLRGEQDGEFELHGVVPGAYTLNAFIFDEDNPRSATLDLEVGESNVDGIALVAVKGKDLTGTLRVEGASDPNYTQFNVILQPKQVGRGGFGGGFGTVKADGTFTLKNLADEEYMLGVGGIPAGGYVKSARLGEENAIETALHPLRAKGGSLEIVISMNAGALEGVVHDKDSNPFAGARVVLIPEKAPALSGGRYYSASTDQNGKFSVKGIRPGSYKAYAWEDVGEEQFLDPDFRADYEDRAVSVRVNEGLQTQDLKLIGKTAETSGGGF